MSSPSSTRPRARSPRARGLPVSPVLALALIALLRVSASEAQVQSANLWSGNREFLNREYYPLWDERYENYSLGSYRDYGVTRDEPQYDPFGMYLVDGQQILLAQEYRTIAPNQGSRASWNLGQFRNMVILNDNYRGWGSRFMMGDLLDGFFSPMALNMARLEGFRWDASSHRNRFSTVISRAPRPMSATRDLAYYILGGHWESNLGDAITFGASYVNFHLQDARQRDSSFRGTFPSTLQTTKANYVMISDDSPEDGQGPKVFDIRLLVNGVETGIEPEIRRLPGAVVVEKRGLRSLETYTVDVDQVPHIRQDGAWAPRANGRRPFRAGARDVQQRDHL